MQVRRHSRKFEMRVEYVLRHIVGIRTREPDAVDSFDGRYRFEQFPERRFSGDRSLRTRFPRERFGVPKFCAGLLSVAVHVLSEERDFFRAAGHRFANLFHYFRNRP